MKVTDIIRPDLCLLPAMSKQFNGLLIIFYPTLNDYFFNNHAKKKFNIGQNKRVEMFAPLLAFYYKLEDRVPAFSVI